MADYKLTLLTEFKDNISNKIKPALKAVEKLQVKEDFTIKGWFKDHISPHLKKITNKFKPLKEAKVRMSADVTKAKAKIEEIKGKLKSIKEKVIPTRVQDKASPILQGIKGKLMSLAAGITFTAVRKVAIEGIGQEQTQKITINRVLENSGQSKKQAKKSTDQYYKFLEQYANKTPFSTQSVAQFGTKAAIIEKGNIKEAKNTTALMGNVKAFVGDMRTEQEVAEAFFSGSTGNMEMLNNMLGTQYKTFEEAKKGIAQNQGGLVDEMSKTLPGAISTLQGVMQVGIKNIFAPFSGGLVGGFTKITEAINVLTPMITSGLQSMLEPLAPLGQMFNGFLDSIINKSPETMGIFSIFGTTIQTVFQMIGAVAQAVGPIVVKILQFIGQNAGVINSIIQLLGQVWLNAWRIIGTALKVAWNIIKPPLDMLSQMLITVKGTVDALRDAWSRAVNFIKDNPIIAKINQVFGGGGKKGPGHASGLARVPYDNYQTRLHQGERVLSRREADEYRNNTKTGITFSKLADTIIVREEADIDRIINGINRKIRLAKRGGV